MGDIRLADAKARLSELIDRVQTGVSVNITRRGKRIARLIPADSPRKPVDLAALEALTAGMAPAKQDAASLVRDMRDTDRF